jgi:hypothetical protein
VNKSVAWRQVGRLFVVVHSETSPTDVEWDAQIRTFTAGRGPIRILVHTEGGAPNAAQRGRLTALLKGRDLAVAVLTNSALARAAGVALRWIRPQLRLFAPSEIERALDYVGSAGQERADVRAALDDLKAKLNPPRTRTG